MKTKLIALIFCVATFSCASKPPVAVSGDIRLQQLSSNGAFLKDESGNFETVPEAATKIRIYVHQFANQTELQSYVLNRRMLLHKGFQDQIAPYFGLIQLNKTCLAKVDTRGESQAAGKDEEFIKMRFPANDNITLSDCSTDQFWGSIEYHFHNCKNTNTVYELRVSRREGESHVPLNPSCN